MVAWNSLSCWKSGSLRAKLCGIISPQPFLDSAWRASKPGLIIKRACTPSTTRDEASQLSFRLPHSDCLRNSSPQKRVRNLLKHQDFTSFFFTFGLFSFLFLPFAFCYSSISFFTSLLFFSSTYSFLSFLSSLLPSSLLSYSSLSLSIPFFIYFFLFLNFPFLTISISSHTTNKIKIIFSVCLTIYYN
jgi:hypothetical protein